MSTRYDAVVDKSLELSYLLDRDNDSDDNVHGYDDKVWDATWERARMNILLCINMYTFIIIQL